MKLSVVLLCATASAFPIQGRDGATTSSVLSTGYDTPPSQPEIALRESSSQLDASVHNYLLRLRGKASALFTDDSSEPKSPPSESTSTLESTEDKNNHAALMESFAFLEQRHKDLIAQAHPSQRHTRSTLRPGATADSDAHAHALHHGPECVLLVIFVLAPISYLFIYFLAFTFKKMTQERFPGSRSRVRLDGPEREAPAIANQDEESIVSEKLLASEKPLAQTLEDC